MFFMHSPKSDVLQVLQIGIPKSFSLFLPTRDGPSTYLANVALRFEEIFEQ